MGSSDMTLPCFLPEPILRLVAIAAIPVWNSCQSCDKKALRRHLSGQR